MSRPHEPATSIHGDGQAVSCRIAVSYVVPLRTEADVTDLARYLRALTDVVDEVMVVDGSSPEARHRHRQAFGAEVDVYEPALITANGKVGGVLTGIARARNEVIVLADDDVRYRPHQLPAILERMAAAEVVRPQNVFTSWPWHAHFDTARTLIARATGGDWPGTLAVQRSVVVAMGGYAGDVMFENLELVRTIEHAGGRHLLALDIVVGRQPPTAKHFWHQQVRQAYDELARPMRLVVSLLAFPAAAGAVAARWWWALAAYLVATVTLAEWGRTRADGTECYPVSSSLLAPTWFLWRSLCSWVALGAWCRGGVMYRGTRLKRAATSSRDKQRVVTRRTRVRPYGRHDGSEQAADFASWSPR